MQRLTAAVAAVLLTVTATVLAQDVKLEEGFVRLDNGKNLEGWTGKTETWSVVDGAILLDAKKAKGNVYSKVKHSRNVIIRLQFKATPRADSGLFVHGKQLQVRDYPTAGPKKYAAPAKPAGEWNDLELDVTDGVAVVKLNGKVIDEKFKVGNKTSQGVGLQKERGNFYFRNVRIKEKK